MHQVIMFVLKNTDSVPNLAIFSCLLCLTSNKSLHHISFNFISMIKEVFKPSAVALHVLMSCIFHRFHKSTEASLYDHVLQQLGSSRADNYIYTLCFRHHWKRSCDMWSGSHSQEGHSHDASLRSKLGGLPPQNRAGDHLSPLPRPFGYLHAISSANM